MPSPLTAPASAAAAPAHETPPPAPAGAVARWHSQQLFGLRHEVEIEHRGAVYRLRITALGKLILTK